MHGLGEKGRLRSHMLEMRRRLGFEEVARLSSLIQRRFVKTGIFRSSERILLYASFKNEVLTDYVFERAKKEGKEVYFPRVAKGAGRSGRGLKFFRVDAIDDLCPGTYEIREPSGHARTAGIGEFDVAIIPGLAFDRSGARLGYGKGYFDKALKDAECPIVALAYGFQVIEGGLPSEPHDVRVSAIVTEKGIIMTDRVRKGA
jgi:5-formyltetrahydrofolate cyclo-ligase